MTLPTVALIGANGYLAKPIASIITSPQYRDKFTLPIRVLSRDPSKVKDKLPDTEVYAAADEAGYEKAFKGVDIVLDLRSAHAVVDSTPVTAAAKAGVKLFSSSDYGIDYQNAGKYTPLFSFKWAAVEKAQKLGLQTVQFHSGFFLEGLLTEATPLGFVSKEGYTDHPTSEHKISVTSVKNIAEAVVSVISRPISEIPKVLRIAGETLSLADFAAAYEKYSGKKLEHRPASIEEITKVADNALATGKADRNDLLHLLRAVTVATKAVDFTENQNDIVNPGVFQWETVDTLAPKILGHL